MRSTTRTNILFGSILLLIGMQLAELVMLFNGVGPAEPSRALWVLTSATTAAIAVLLIGARMLIANEGARSEAIAEYLNDGLLFMDGSRVVFANTLARKLLNPNAGHARPLMLTSQLESVLEVVRKSHSPLHYEATVDGRPRHFLVSRLHLPHHERQMFVFQDVTFLRENEEAKVNFIGTLSHEIKTPITSLAMALAMIERTGYDAELLRIANADVGRLRSLLDDLLNVSRLKVVRNPESLHKRETNLSGLLQQIVKTVQPMAEGKQVRLMTVIQPRGQITADIDPTKISWVLSTLLTDAIRQTPPGHTVLTEMELVRAGEASQAVVTISYERRLDSLGPTGHAIVRDIIEGHAGRFVSLHKAGHDSSFRFTLHAYLKGQAPNKEIKENNEANLTG